jgi:DNA-directed RNA polymerase specialized sigma24 family protein
MRATLMLQLRAAQTAAKAQDVPFRPELLLADAGFAHRDIATMLGKSQVAVAKAIGRGRAMRKQSADERPGGRGEANDE